MSEKILYILGAGASANVFPLAKDIYHDNGNIKKPGLAKELKEFQVDIFFKDYRENIWPIDIQKLKQKWSEIGENAEIFGDVDTYAKYLKILGEIGKLQELKQTLSEYFTVRQLMEKARDRRYLPWLVSLMDRKKFPDNIKILSWNYDFQIQLAFEHFNPLEDVNHSGTGFTHSGLALNYYPNLDPTFSDFHLLSLIHLNGIAGYIKKEGLYTASVFQKVNNSSKESLLEFFKNNKNNCEINFAWENQYQQTLIDHINKMIVDTTILVVVGYSFPFFNREIDKKIFEQLKGMQTLRKIYYQDPILTGDQLYSQFDLDEDLIKIEHIQQTNNFHIPFEY